MTIKELLAKRAMSWSMMSSFDYDPEQWYRTYVLNEKQESKEMTFGSWVDKKIQDDPTFLPSLTRYEKMQYKMKVMFSGIPLVGIPDGLNFTGVKKLADYKTGKKKWDKKRADETGQLTFYLLLLYITHKIKPEEFELYIHWLPTKDNGDFTITFVDDIDKNIKTIATKRTMVDLLKFGERIKETVDKMDAYLLAKSTASDTLKTP